MRRPLLLAVVAVLSLAAPATAQVGGNIELDAFRPSMDSRGYITVNASQILGHKEVSFGLVLDWAGGPLKLTSNLGTAACVAPATTPCFADGGNFYAVNNIISPTLQAAIGLFRVVEVGVSAPFRIVNGDAGPDYSGALTNPNDDDNFSFDSQGLGDVGVHAKIRFLNTSTSKFGLALLGSVYIPGGYEKNQWLGENAVTFQPMMIIDKEWGKSRRWRTAGNLGFRLRTGKHQYVEAVSGDEEYNALLPPIAAAGTVLVEAKSEIPFGVGASYGVVPGVFDLLGEVYGGLSLGGKAYMPLEAVVGMKVYLAKNSFLLLGGGAGLIPGETANTDFRAFIGMIFEPSIGDRDGDGIKDDVDECPSQPEDFDDFMDKDGCPDEDNDKDGILDPDDSCPVDPEDKDGVEDQDGCPDNDALDRDGDGLNDDVDKCPDDPEDKDQFEDEDGCPDDDNDKDGVVDIDDQCRNDPEDKDQFEDEDGCPDNDNDKDRIADNKDTCPIEPETYNGVEDEDGCPDRGRVIVNQSNIEILDKIYFETKLAVIKPESFPLLDAIAATIVGNPDILLIEIQGHADERGNDADNMQLTDDRAHSVMKYLTDKGVEAERLQAKGYGETKPIDPGHNEDAWSKNRRVEFIILKRVGQ